MQWSCSICLRFASAPWHWPQHLWPQTGQSPGHVNTQWSESRDTCAAAAWQHWCQYGGWWGQHSSDDRYQIKCYSLQGATKLSISTNSYSWDMEKTANLFIFISAATNGMTDVVSMLLNTAKIKLFEISRQGKTTSQLARERGHFKYTSWHLDMSSFCWILLIVGLLKW